MLPEFPKAKQAIQNAWFKVIFAETRSSDPFISKIAVRAQREGNRAFWGESEIEYRKHSVTCRVPTEIAKGVTTEEFFGMAESLGQEMAKGQARRLFEVIETPGPRIITFDNGDGQLTLELWLSKMATMEIDFDERGVPKWPSFVLAPSAAEELKESLVNLSTKQIEHLGRFLEIKKREFDERTSRRRLVD